MHSVECQASPLLPVSLLLRFVLNSPLAAAEPPKQLNWLQAEGLTDPGAIRNEDL